jgi:hypothetical protein
MKLTEDESRNDALKHALQRQSAPDGFTERVLLKVEKQRLETLRLAKSSAVPRDSLLTFFTRPLARWAAAVAIASAMIAGIAGGIHVQNMRRERAEGEAAKQRLMLALRIAGSKLQLARSRVNQINASPVNANQTHPDQTEN